MARKKALSLEEKLVALGHYLVAEFGDGPEAAEEPKKRGKKNVEEDSDEELDSEGEEESEDSEDDEGDDDSESDESIDDSEEDDDEDTDGEDDDEDDDEDDEDEKPAKKNGKGREPKVEDVQAALKARAKKKGGGEKGRLAALKILKEVGGVKAVKDLSPKKYGAVIAALQ
jgi:hypothetical protein